jgi:hypothetical protein
MDARTEPTDGCKMKVIHARMPMSLGQICMCDDATRTLGGGIRNGVSLLVGKLGLAMMVTTAASALGKLFASAIMIEKL